MPGADHHIIIHPGIVDHLEKDRVFVRILSQSACSSCHAKGFCSVSEVEEKIIEVNESKPEDYHPGDAVTVKMKQSLGQKAVLLGYVIPLVILVASIVIFLMFLPNEGLAALLSILMLAPYYGVLYLMRNKLKKQFSFSICSEE